MRTYLGFQVIVDDVACSKTVEDWSRVRSPSRAIRRRKKGHRQNIELRVVLSDAYVLGDKIVMHSEHLRQLEKRVLADIDRLVGQKPRSQFASGGVVTPDTLRRMMGLVHPGKSVVPRKSHNTPGG